MDTKRFETPLPVQQTDSPIVKEKIKQNKKEKIKRKPWETIMFKKEDFGILDFWNNFSNRLEISSNNKDSIFLLWVIKLFDNKLKSLKITIIDIDEIIFSKNMISILYKDANWQIKKDSFAIKSDEKILERAESKNQVIKKQKKLAEISPKEFSKKLNTWNLLLVSMNSILEKKNSTKVEDILSDSFSFEWGMEWISSTSWTLSLKQKEKDTEIKKSELSVKDVALTWPANIKWKNLIELQSQLKEILTLLDTKKPSLSEIQQKQVLDLEKKYLEIFIWIWDKNEDRAIFMKPESTDKLDKILDDIIRIETPENILEFLLEKHNQIDGNDYQSTDIENVYKTFSDKMNEKILYSFKHKWVEDKYFIEFAKIITWKKTDINWYKNDIDDLLRDENTANDALLFLFAKNGTIGKIRNINYAKENIVWTPRNIISEFEKEFNLIVDENKETYKTNERPEFRTILQASWYSDILDLKNKKAEQLTPWQKTKLIIVSRFLKEIKENNLYTIKKYLSSTDKIENTKWDGFFSSVTNIAIDVRNFATETTKWVLTEGKTKLFYFIEKFNDVNADYITDLYDSKDSFSRTDLLWLDSRDIWYKWTEAESLNLFLNINWNWMLNFSDKNVWRLKTIWKIAWVFAAWMLAPPLILWTWAWTITYLVTGWVAWAVASTAIMPHWYNTIEEWKVDIASNVAVWIWTWLIGSGGVARASKVKKVPWLVPLANAADIGIWMWSEVRRSSKIHDYYWHEILTETKK